MCFVIIVISTTTIIVISISITVLVLSADHGDYDDSLVGVASLDVLKGAT